MSQKTSALSHYRFTFVLTAIILVVATLLGGPRVILPISVLALIEVTFSFDNAVLNSQVLGTMNRFWQKMFLTIGIALAVFGVRLILPLVLVATTAHHGLGSVLDLALHHPDQYAAELESAYPLIASFGGVFLLMIGLRFFGEKKDVVWLNTIEGPLSEFNQPWWISISGAMAAIVVMYTVLAPGDMRVMTAGALGAGAFLLVKLAGELLIGSHGDKPRFKEGSHQHGLMQFLYLELLDASFSFDGVIAAFAITKEVLLIAVGLGIGAMYVRSMTMHLLERQTLAHYRYLIHGAHYAILALSLLLLASIKHPIPDMVTGILGLLIIGSAFESSRQHNKKAMN